MYKFGEFCNISKQIYQLKNSPSGFQYKYLFYKKLRIWARIENFFKFSDFEYSEFLKCLLPVPMNIWRCFWKLFQCLDITQYLYVDCLPSDMMQETSENKVNLCY